MDAETKKIVLDLIKSTDYKHSIIENPVKRKWCEFGGYDVLRTLSEKVKEYPDAAKKETTSIGDTASTDSKT